MAETIFKDVSFNPNDDYMDSVKLRSGETIFGEISGFNDNKVRFAVDGQDRVIDRTDILGEIQKRIPKPTGIAGVIEGTADEYKTMDVLNQKIIEAQKRKAQSDAFAKRVSAEQQSTQQSGITQQEIAAPEGISTIPDGTAPDVLGQIGGGLADLFKGVGKEAINAMELTGMASPDSQFGGLGKQAELRIKTEKENKEAAIKLAEAEAKKIEAEAKSKEGTIQTIKGRKVIINKAGEVIKDLGPDVSGASVAKANQGLVSVRDLKSSLFGSEAAKKRFNDVLIQAKLSNVDFLGSQQGRAVQGAMRNAIDIILRERTGAAINPEEFNNAMQSWGLRLGDSPELVEKKLADLELMLNLMKGEIDPDSPDQEKRKQAIEAERNIQRLSNNIGSFVNDKDVPKAYKPSDPLLTDNAETNAIIKKLRAAGKSDERIAAYLKSKGL